MRKEQTFYNPLVLFVFSLMLGSACTTLTDKQNQDKGLNDLLSGGEIAVYVAGDSRVHKTAAEELAFAFDLKPGTGFHPVDHLPPDGPAVIAGLVTEVGDAMDLIRQGKINLHKVPPHMDVYELLLEDNRFYLLGNTPRGMLQAVYKFQEVMRSDVVPGSGFHEKGTFQFNYRVFHPSFEYWPGTREDIRYISHLGATHCLHDHDWQGDRRHFQGYVTSPIFPEAVDPEFVEEGHRELRRLIDDCKDYGLETCMWITELPCQGGPWVPEETRQKFLQRYPKEVLSESGTYQGKVLCFSHPKVREFYSDLMERFFRDFPEISILFVMGLDADGEFCDPETCSRCKGMSKFEQRDRFVNFLIDEGQKFRPGLRVLTTSWGWDRRNPEEFRRRQKELPAASGVFMAAETDGWQAERQTHDQLLNIRNICRERDQLFIGYDDLHWGDDAIHGLNDIQDYPLVVGAKLERWHNLGADGVFDHWGSFNSHISSNSVACREFFLDPLADAETVGRKIALQQFGENAGEAAFQAWRSLERAHAIMSNYSTWPPSQWPNWYAGKNFAPLPESFETKGLSLPAHCVRYALPFVYNDSATSLQGVSDAWKRAYPHYMEAVRHLDEAIAEADDTPVFYSYWWSGEAESPSRLEHLRRQQRYIEGMGLVGREIGIHFGLNALYNRLDGDAEAYLRESGPLIREDIEACRAIAEFFGRTSFRSDYYKQMYFKWKELYSKKAALSEAYLSEN